MLKIPRLVVAALRGGSGKTILTIGLLSELRRKGLRALGFKKGPDFIDPGWITLASGNPCRNLDAYIMDPQRLLDHFIWAGAGYDMVLVEGNRGVFDGMDQKGSFSTSELSKLLRAPVCLVIDVTMATRTVAALVKGCQVFDPGMDLRAVVINKVANSRQETLIKWAIEGECGIPVVGALPRRKENPFPERHMGLLPYQENEKALEAIKWAEDLIRGYVDVDALVSIASSAPFLDSYTKVGNPTPMEPRVKIGILLDKSFWFYYPENLELLRSLGAELVLIDSTTSKQVPNIHGLYIGGGFPETQAKALADNTAFRRHLKSLTEKGLPVYAECGGLIYLGKELNFRGESYPMLEIFPVKFEFQERPAGHGYTEFVPERQNPYFELNKPIKGHEFHYSVPRLITEEEPQFVFKVLRGNGFDGLRDGLLKGHVLGTYMHVHALGESQWAKSLIRLAQSFLAEQAGGQL